MHNAKRFLIGTLMVAGCSGAPPGRVVTSADSSDLCLPGDPCRADGTIDYGAYPKDTTLVVGRDTVVRSVDVHDTIYWRAGCENDLSSARCTAPLPKAVAR